MRKGAIAVVSVIAAIAIALAAYVATGPHGALEVVAASPLAGPDARYQLDGVISAAAEADGKQLPQAEIPFKARVAGGRCRVELFADRGGQPVFESFVVPDGNGGFVHRDRGSIAGAASAAGALAAMAGIGEDDALGALGLPDPADISLSEGDVVGMASKLRLDKAPSSGGYEVSLAGPDVAEALVAGGADGSVAEMLSDAVATVAYDAGRRPSALRVDGIRLGRELDLGALGRHEVSVELGAEGTFGRIGEVSDMETEVPAELLGEDGDGN